VKGVAEVDKTSGGPVPRDQLRAGNEDRERVVKRLNDAFSEGRLELAELEERVTAAYAAKTIGELAPLTADLPGGTPTSGTVPPPSWPPPAWPPPVGPSRVSTPGRQPTVQDLKQAAIELAHSKINAKLERDRARQQRHAARHDRQLARHQRHHTMPYGHGARGWATWASVSAICFTIWLITVLTGGGVYPWFLWVAGPWGVMLLLGTLGNHRRPSSGG
jgi:uncharacterized protein DUF1707